MSKVDSTVTGEKLNRGRNQSMELAKLVASFFVVFIHVHFPDKWGGIVDCLGMFAVPMFFAISGYFNYGADSGKVWKRFKHIAALYVTGVAAWVLWHSFVTEMHGGSTIRFWIQCLPDPDEFSRWIIMQLDPFSGQLWYLNATMVVYLLYWGYVRFFWEKKVDYKAFYFLALALFAVYFGFNVIWPVTEPEVIVQDSRNAWFTGIPMFALGLFLREYQEQIFRNFKLPAWKLIAVVVLGAAFSVYQMDTVGMGMPLGTLFEVVALMLLLISHPQITGKSKLAGKFVGKCGAWSTWIYLLHLLAENCYGNFMREKMTVVLGSAEGWLHPVIVLGMSWAAAVVCDWGSGALKKMKFAIGK